MNKYYLSVLLLVSLIVPTATVSAEVVKIEFQIPSFETSQYRRPFVAIWVEEKGNWRKSQTFALWFDDDQWLKDIRRWWRKVGRYNKDLDGFSGATKPAGHYSIERELALKSGVSYVLYLEAVREHGNRTLLKTPISSNDIGRKLSVESGHEIGPVSIYLQQN